MTDGVLSGTTINVSSPFCGSSTKSSGSGTTAILYPFNMMTAVAVVRCTASLTAVLPQPQRETTRAAIRAIAKMIFFIRKGSFRQALKSKEKL